MAHPTAVILVVGLTESLLEHAPRMQALAGQGGVSRLRPVLPAVTCSVQSSMLTGQKPSRHGVVGNGWYNRELAEVQFWKQSNHLVGAPKVWDTARRQEPGLTCANLFWWYNMYSAVDYSVTPRPIYKADGRKLPDCYTHPAPLRDELQNRLGTFPLFHFWGPASSIASSAWIAQAAQAVRHAHQPGLTLVYLPHLDYALQQVGPRHGRIPAEVAAIDEVVGKLLDDFAAQGVRCMIVSEYGVEAVDKPVHINRLLREAGLIQVREEQGLEILDPGASRAFAVADHQIAHVYVRDAHDLPRVSEICTRTEGVEHVLARDRQKEWGIDHARAGELVLVAAERAWFTYYYWLDDRLAPDFARTVDIHRKPGYDPVELFLDPALRAPRLAIGRRLLMRRLGLRTLLDVIPLDASLVRGSHGRLIAGADGPLCIMSHPPADFAPESCCTAVHDLVLGSLFTA